MKTPGSYLLTIKLSKATTAKLGKRTISLPKGWYCYAGSALGGLEGRLSRHLSVSRPKHWHIDHLLTAGTVVDIQVIPSDKKTLECEFSALCGAQPNSSIIPGFG